MEFSQDRARNKAVFHSLHLVQKVLGCLKAGRTSTHTLRAPHCRVGPLGGPGEFVVHLAYFPSSSVGDSSTVSAQVRNPKPILLPEHTRDHIVTMLPVPVSRPTHTQRGVVIGDGW